MKSRTYFISILAVMALLVITGCKEQTELAFINSNDSADNINDIIFNGSTTWSKSGGYARGTQTESKEVSSTSGTIDVSIWNGTDYVSATNIITNDVPNSISIDEGSSEVVVLIVYIP